MTDNREQYKRIVSYGQIVVLFAIYTVCYSILWKIKYLNEVVVGLSNRGFMAMILIYPFLLLVFGKLFGVFKIYTAKKTDFIFSCTLTTLISNALVYCQVVILLRVYPSVWPLIALWGSEIILAFAWIFAVKAMDRAIFPTHDMLLIYGDYSPKDIVLNVNKYKGRYAITETAHLADGPELYEKILKHESVILSDVPAQERNDVLKFCYERSIRVYMLPKITDIIIRSSDDLDILDSPVLLAKNFGLTFDQKVIKRIGDIFVSGLMLVVFSWLMGIIALIIKLGDKGPVFYKQERLTRDGKTFNIIKFRSMRTDAEAKGPQLSTKGDPRVTPVGRIIRATHLDELPQLLNVFKGDMSMVGPRPERPAIMEEYINEVPEFKYRLKVKGGLTGYAQVFGRYNTTPYNKLRLDLTYIQNYSIWLDIKCLLLTVKILFQKDNTEGIDANQRTALKK